MTEHQQPADMAAQAAEPMTEAELTEILQVRRDKLAQLQAAGKDPFEIVRYDQDTAISAIQADYEAYEGRRVSIAGRLMSKRGMGKSTFCDIQDRDGRIQLYVRINELGEEAYDAFKKLDLGDIVGVVGEVFKTRMGEISVKTTAVTLLSKSLRPLPEKFHGLKDPDTRYRQRYLDLIVNPEVRRTFITRSRIIAAIRRFLDERGFLEVDTPILNTIAGGATARPFITHHNTLDLDMYMRIAPELFHKRLIVGGLERVYELGRMFRKRGHVHQAQSGIHHDGALPGVHRLPWHDGNCGNAHLHGGPGSAGINRHLLSGNRDRPHAAMDKNDHDRGGEAVCRRGFR
jgi:lysyl-tRNA synthetase class 2